MESINNKLPLILSYLLVAAVLLANINNGFFWDTVLYASKHAGFYFSTNFNSLLLPDAIDCGTIPVFGMYIALAWKLFGRTLPVSHLAMLPFAIGIVWQLFRLCLKFIPPKYAGITLLLLLADTTILSQMTLVSPDIPLVFLFLLAVNAVLENRRMLLLLGIFFLFVVNTRGAMVAFCILLLDLYANIDFKAKKTLFIALLKRSLIYLPGTLLFIGFNIYHLNQKGWIFTHADSPWKDTHQAVNATGVLFNFGLLGWRLLDYGKIGVWLIGFYLVARYQKNLFSQKKIHVLLFLFCCLLLFVHLDMLWANNLLAHRYFIPINIIFALTCASILFSDLLPRKAKQTLGALWFLIMVSGSFWIYPQKISQGWDSTLAHLPYYELRHKAIDYLNEQKIDFSEVQTFFPNTATLDIIDLNHDQRNFNTFDGNSYYLFYSNIYNVNSVAEETIEKKYFAVKKFEDRGIFIVIYQKRQ